MEKRDLYDLERNLTGETIYKGDLIPVNRRIVVVLVFIQNSSGKFLIQKRSLIKEGKYASTGGHPKSGESSMEGMLTEIREELGMKVIPEELTFLYSEEMPPVFVDVYYLKKDISIQELTLQEEEVESVHWYTEEDIHQLYMQGKFMETHYIAFQKVLKYFCDKKD